MDSHTCDNRNHVIHVQYNYCCRIQRKGVARTLLQEPYNPATRKAGYPLSVSGNLKCAWRAFWKDVLEMYKNSVYQPFSFSSKRVRVLRFKLFPAFSLKNQWFFLCHTPCRVIREFLLPSITFLLPATALLCHFRYMYDSGLRGLLISGKLF